MAALFVRIALLVAVAAHSVQGYSAEAAGPLLHQDCTLSWNPNGESDLGGYRLYFGRLASQLSQVRDIGLRTSIRCSEAQAGANGQWFVAIAAYDTSGNVSALSQALPFELAGIAAPAPRPQLVGPASVALQVRPYGFQLTWIDWNLPPVSHRIIVSSSHRPVWTTAALLPPGVTQFSYFQPADEEWVCYRVRAESDEAASQAAQHSEYSEDGRSCFHPNPAPVIVQPLLAPTIFPEPQNVRLRALQPGFELTWSNPGGTTISHRIEVSGSVDSRWTTLASLPPGATRFRYQFPIDAEWVCLRIRGEQQRLVSLWAMAGDPTDRQFCFRPGL